jgi:superfamily II RNA helicase
MKKILEESSDGIVVYVAPTKALVNQVSAEVYARFKNECSKLKVGISIFGIFTRDIRFNPLSCRVLVTVPQCLEILLLSPVHESWSGNIKYVIFDEVHSIADRGSGEVWEHLFSIINCPFLALSATIQDTTPFCNWLQSKLNQQNRKRTKSDLSQTSNINSNFQLSFIQYNQRYSDLAYYHYCNESLQHVHPYSLLTTDGIRSEGFPSDMHLQPSHLVELYDYLSETKLFVSLGLQHELTALHYDNVKEFKSGKRILKLDVRNWQAKLQVFICSMIEKGYGGLVDNVGIFNL